MKKGDVVAATIKRVRIHKEERMVQGATFGTYDSAYIGELNEYPNGIVILNDYAEANHPGWKNKTEDRAVEIETELKGKVLQIVVTDVFSGDNKFQGVIKYAD